MTTALCADFEAKVKEFRAHQRQAAQNSAVELIANLRATGMHAEAYLVTQVLTRIRAAA